MTEEQRRWYSALAMLIDVQLLVELKIHVDAQPQHQLSCQE